MTPDALAKVLEKMLERIAFHQNVVERNEEGERGYSEELLATYRAVETLAAERKRLREALNALLECVSRMRWQIARLPNSVRDEAFQRDLEQLLKAAQQGEAALSAILAEVKE